MTLIFRYILQTALVGFISTVIITPDEIVEQKITTRNIRFNYNDRVGIVDAAYKGHY